MTIAVSCQCGQRFSVKEELAGKKGKCPKCGTIFRIPSASSSPPPPPLSSVPPPPPASNPLDDFAGLGSMFDEEGIGVAGRSQVGPGQGKLCPECRKVVPVQALLCVECGWNFEENKKFETKRGKVKNPLDNPYGVDPYFDEEDDMYTGGRRKLNRDPDHRRGPAWELDGSLIGNYVQTVTDILLTPAFAFGHMSLYGGYASPLSFVLVGYVFAYIISTFISYAVISMFGVMPCTGQPYPAEMIPALGLSMLCSMLVGVSCLLVVLGLLLPIPMFISSAVLHLCLMIVGGAKRELEATFRTTSYVLGALVMPVILLIILPVIGQILASLLQWIYTVIAIKHTHEIEWWKALVASVLWVVIMFALVFGFFLIFITILASAFDLSNGIPLPKRP